MFLAIPSKSLLCRPRISLVKNKRLEVHACSPRPHFPSSSHTLNQPSSLFSLYVSLSKKPSFSSCFALPLSYLDRYIFFTLALYLSLFLSFYYAASFSFGSFTVTVTLSFSFLGLRRKELFLAALLFANLRRVYTSSGFTLDRSSPFTCFTRC